MQNLLDLMDEKQVDKEHLAKQVVLKQVPKNTKLQSYGSTKMNLYFVKSGCLRAFTIDESGKEHIYMFGPEGWIVSDIQGMITKQPSRLEIEAIEDSIIEYLPAHLFYEKDSFFRIVGSLGVEKLLRRIASLQQRVIMLMSATALERYQEFIIIYPSLVKRIPQKMIASYLGITPQALSVLKRRVKI